MVTFISFTNVSAILNKSKQKNWNRRPISNHHMPFWLHSNLFVNVCLIAKFCVSQMDSRKLSNYPSKSKSEQSLYRSYVIFIFFRSNTLIEIVN